jgi:transposase
VIESLIGQGINIRHACRVLGVSESGYYAWKGRPDPPRTLRRIWLAGEIADIHKASGGTYGEMRVTAELRHGRQIVVGHNAVGSIMRELGLEAAYSATAQGRAGRADHLAGPRAARVPA